MDIDWGDIFGAAVAAAMVFFLGPFAAFGAIPLWGQAAIVGIASLSLSAVAGALTPQPEMPNLRSFSSTAAARTSTIKQAITPWHICYGEFLKSGPLTYIETTDSHHYLHMIITVASHPCEAIEAIFFNEYPIYPEDIDTGNDNVISAGRFANTAWIYTDLGTIGSQPFQDLVDFPNIQGWTDAHRQEGMTKVYIRLRLPNRDKYPGIPNFKFRIKGRKILDTRTSTTLYSDNPALCIRDFMTTANKDGGLGLAAADMDTTILNASANTCDEFVTTLDVIRDVKAVDATNDWLDLVGDEDPMLHENFVKDILEYQTGDRVQVTTTVTLPGGISAVTNYYVILKHEVSTEYHDLRIQLASSYLNALAGTAIDITDAGSGTHTITKNAEPRFHCHGVAETDRTPFDILDEMRTSMAGRIVPVGGSWLIKAGAWSSPTITFDEDDMIAAMVVVTKQPRRERFNAVQGIYATPLAYGKPTDYPPVTSATYETEDNSERLFRVLDLAYTSRPQTAQRIAKIELERHRRQISVDVKLNLTGLQVQAIDTVMLDNTRAGWNDKTFEIAEWTLSAEGNPPAIGVRMKLRESDSSVFTFDAATEEITQDPAPRTYLPDPTDVGTPSGLVVTESLYTTRDGAGVKTKAAMSWIASVSGYVDSYQVEYKLSADSDWIVRARTEGTTDDIYDITPGTYDFRVKAVSSTNIFSDYTTTALQEIYGLLSPPAEPQSLVISRIGGLAILRWDLSTDLDVRIGGEIVFRHSKELSGATWPGSVRIGLAVPGNETVVSLPLKEGTYLAKARDSSGIFSVAVASVSTKQATILSYTQTDTLSEHTTYVGSHSNTIAADNVLKLALDGTFIDDWGLIDDEPDIDGTWPVFSSGTYTFASSFDFGSIVRRRLTTIIGATVTNVLELFDSREDPIDDWTDFDGAGTGDADCRVWMRETDDDPGGAPTWSEWQLLDSAEAEARAIQFKATLTSDDGSYNIYVDTLTVNADSI